MIATLPTQERVDEIARELGRDWAEDPVYPDRQDGGQLDRPGGPSNLTRKFTDDTW